MRFLRLPDYLIRPLFEDDDIIAVDKPYGFNTHTNDSKLGQEDLIQHGLIEIFERQMGYPLHVIHRLDRTTTGVLIFGKSADSAKKYKTYFFNREVKKTYLFVTAHKSAKPEFEIDQPISHKGKELEASTRFNRIASASNFDLWQANPYTGRNHQIRIHAQAGGISLLGDEKYGGARYGFLCLHNGRMEFPNGFSIEAAPPKYFTNLSILSSSATSRIFHESDRRERLFAANREGQSFRIVHQTSEDSEYTIDHLGDRLLVSWLSEKVNESSRVAAQRFADSTGQLLVERHQRKDAAPIEKETWLTKEDGLTFEVETGSALFPGPLIDQRLLRAWVKKHSTDRSVLNLFAGVCGFAVAAVAGGAKQVTAVESSKAAIQKGRRNFELSGLEPASLLARDSLIYLEACKKKDLRFDLVICHAPAFYRGEKKTFRIENDLSDLLRNCLGRLNTGGEFLFLTNAQDLYVDDLRRRIIEVLDGSNAEVSLVLPSLDLELVEEKPHLKAFLIKPED